MFGLFKGKAARLPSVVAPELRAALKHETALPHAVAPAQDTRCAQARVDGMPPKSRFVAPEFDGATRSALRVASRPGLAPLGIVNMGGEVRRREERPALYEERVAREAQAKRDPGVAGGRG